MKNILITCDLDNTLIHSYKHKRENDICIEWLNDKEQSFMDPGVYDLVTDIKRYARFVPVTTRSIAQYMRIKWNDEACPEYAVTTNGAILLDKTERDSSWDEESDKLVVEYKEEMDRLLSEVMKEDVFCKCRIVDDMYVFAYCNEGIDAKEISERYVGKTSLDIAGGGRKLYFFPQHFNKGSAVKRLCERFDAQYVIAAGDSEIDIPMLELADLAFCREEIFDKVNNSNKRLFNDEKELMNAIRNEISK